MAKSTCLFALFLAVVVCYTEAIRIDTAQSTQRNDKPIRGLTKNDPRCKEPSGKFADPKDCTKYIKCVDGNSREMKCPPGYKFDSTYYCISPSENPDCGSTKLSGPLDVEDKCPEKHVIFPVKSDCRKFVVCRVSERPVIKECSPGHIWNDAIAACVVGNQCPPQSSEDSVCEKPNQVLTDEKDDKGYIKCVNFRATKRKCRPGTAFDPRKQKCTKEQLQKIKNNDIRNFEQNE